MYSTVQYSTEYEYATTLGLSKKWLTSRLPKSQQKHEKPSYFSSLKLNLVLFYLKKFSKGV